MKNWEINILKEVFEDKELDVFGIYRKRALELKKRKQNKIFKIEIERKRRKNILFYRNATNLLINNYGKDGAIPYLKVLFAFPCEGEK